MIVDKKIRESIAMFENQPYHEFIGVKVRNIGDGCAELSVFIKRELVNLHGAVHGGIYYTICDLAAAAALGTRLNYEYVFVTSDINVSVVSVAVQGELIVSANVLKMGKRLAFVESKVFNDDKLIAVARITKSILSDTGAHLG